MALLVVAGSGPARADQNDPRLDELFGRLQVAGGPHQARMIEGLIWSIWLESGSDTVDLLVHRGIGAMSEERYADALELFDTVVELAPEFAEGWNKRATVHYLMGHFSESMSDVEKTLELEPRHFGALSGLGLIYGQLDEEEEALKAFERALEVNPHLPQASAFVRELRKKIKGEGI